MAGMTITVRGLEPELHRLLREQARAHGRSMEAEARAILARGVGAAVTDVAWGGSGVAVEAGDQWLARARARFAELWADPDWDDDWVPRRSAEAAPPVSLG